MDKNRQENICKCCGKKFITYENYETCSLDCKRVLEKYGTQIKELKYTNVCSMCGKDFKTNRPNKNLCSYECRQEHARERSREYARRARNTPHVCEPCIICGYDLTTDQHKERGKTYPLCPNHHALITRNIKTLAELKQENNIV